MRRSILAALALLVAACAAPVVVTAQAAPPVKTIGIAPAAKHTLDSLAKDARATRTENAACLTHYAVTGDTLILLAFGPAQYAKADSANLWTRGDAHLCVLGAPTLHSHIEGIVYPPPSDTDLATQRLIGVWGMILSVRDTAWRIIVY